MSNEKDAAFLRDLAGRMYRTATPALGFDQHDTDQLHRIARDLATPAPDSEKLREALRQCRDQFRYYEREHLAAGKIAKAGTNRTFAELADAALGASL